MCKELSSPISSGGFGGQFENHVQASFVVLMLTGGFAPCLPRWPITEIKLQGRNQGYQTDDLIVWVENPVNSEKRRLLGQAKCNISVTKSDKEFREFIAGAWLDFNSPKVFTKGKDVIVLFTGALSGTDEKNVQWILRQARSTKDKADFYRNIDLPKFKPPKCREKFNVICHHLKQVNKGVDVASEEVYNFLKHVYILDYDLGHEEGVYISLFQSYMSSCTLTESKTLWGRITEYVRCLNPEAGTITLDLIPEGIKEHFSLSNNQQSMFTPQATYEDIDFLASPHPLELAIACLIGGWNEKNPSDVKVVSEIAGEEYKTWIGKLRLCLPKCKNQVFLKNGHWRIFDRKYVFEKLGSMIHDDHLQRFKTSCVSILKKSDTSIIKSTEECIVELIIGGEKEKAVSPGLKGGISEGLAILGSQGDLFKHCSGNLPKQIANQVVRDVLSSGDYLVWGNVQDSLPLFAEAAPQAFLEAVEKAIAEVPSPLHKLCEMGREKGFEPTCLVGLFWALEALAWYEDHFSHACAVLGKIAHHNICKDFGNGPLNSLYGIFSVQTPRTSAPIERKIAAINHLYNEYPEVCFDVVISLLPLKPSAFLNSYKPKQREFDEPRLTRSEISTISKEFSSLCVSLAARHPQRTVRLLIDVGRLAKDDFEIFLKDIEGFAEEEFSLQERRLIWESVEKTIVAHRAYAAAQWALAKEDLDKLELVASKLTPPSPLEKYQYLFTERECDLYDQQHDWEHQQKKLHDIRRKAIQEILDKGGIKDVFEFSKLVEVPYHVGFSLAEVTEPTIDKSILPEFLGSKEPGFIGFAKGFTHNRLCSKGKIWFDSLDMEKWKKNHHGLFFSFFAFSKDTWDEVEKWMGNDPESYWLHARPTSLRDIAELEYAVGKLLAYKRPNAACSLLYGSKRTFGSLLTGLCIKVLLDIPNSKEEVESFDFCSSRELIKLLQNDPNAPLAELERIEWIFLPVLEGYMGSRPKTLWQKMADDSDFFLEVIRKAYLSSPDSSPNTNSFEQERSIAMNAYRLLKSWKIVPGQKIDGTFDSVHFRNWYDKATVLSSETGCDAYFASHFGEVLVYSPSDPNGLWLHKSIAELLDDEGSGELRRSYKIGLFNSRGAHVLSEAKDRELADSYRKKAYDIDNSGLYRLAKILRDLAGEYDSESKRY